MIGECQTGMMGESGSAAGMATSLANLGLRVQYSGADCRLFSSPSPDAATT
jgi:hypothetical protein